MRRFKNTRADEILMEVFIGPAPQNKKKKKNRPQFTFDIRTLIYICTNVCARLSHQSARFRVNPKEKCIIETGKSNAILSAKKKPVHTVKERICSPGFDSAVLPRNLINERALYIYIYTFATRFSKLKLSRTVCVCNL